MRLPEKYVHRPMTNPPSVQVTSGNQTAFTLPPRPSHIKLVNQMEMFITAKTAKPMTKPTARAKATNPILSAVASLAVRAVCPVSRT